MKIQIKNRWTASVIFETDADSLGAAISAALFVKTNLRSADLRSADLCSADLRGANLCSADLTGEDLEKLLSIRTIVPEGDLIGWKMLQHGVICKLKIPAKAKRVGGWAGRKCRAEYAVVLQGKGESIHNGHKYQKGKTVRPDKFDPNPLVECSHGIHFFITRREAEDYQ